MHNPDLERILQDDEDMAGFILKFYGPKMQELYHSFPFGVMRSDFWRYAVVYAKGGIYADTDVKCLKPLRDWFPPAGPKVKAGRLNPATIPAAGILHYTDLRWSDCSIVIGVEGHEGLCQWVRLHICNGLRSRLTLKLELLTFSFCSRFCKLFCSNRVISSCI